MKTYQSEDLVYPVHPFDGTAALHDVYCVFLRFDDVLAAAKLRDALWKVLSIGDWRKLGGRIRRRDAKFEIHVPKEYTEERPPMNFVHESFDCSIAEHPVAGHFPPVADCLDIRGPPKDLSQLALCSHFPHTIQDVIDKDVPQLSFKMMTFLDATLLATSFVHITWDAFGFLGLMKAVQQVLEGRETDILPVLGTHNDVLEELARPYLGCNGAPSAGDASAEQPIPQATSTPQSPPLPVEERLLSIPLTIMDRLRDRLKQETASPNEDEFLRNDEMCLAWMVQQMARAEQQPGDVSLVNLLNARVLVPSLWRAKGTYPQNMFLLAPNVVTAETASGPIEPIVTSQRDSLAQFAGPQQAGKYLASFFGNMDAKIIGILLDASRHIPILVNNLSKLTNRLDIDLSSTIVKQGHGTTRANKAGTPNLFYLANLSGPALLRSLVMLGNVTGQASLISGALPKPAWDAIEAYLKSL